MRKRIGKFASGAPVGIGKTPKEIITSLFEEHRQLYDEFLIVIGDEQNDASIKAKRVLDLRSEMTTETARLLNTCKDAFEYAKVMTEKFNDQLNQLNEEAKLSLTKYCNEEERRITAQLTK